MTSSPAAAHRERERALHMLPAQTVPAGLEGLVDLALDLRWTWNHASDSLWRQVDPVTWQRTRNPWLILQNVTRQRLEELADSKPFRDLLAEVLHERHESRAGEGWYHASHAREGPRGVAYFSMEFGLGESLPLYAGGLGVLAGDYLKSSADLGVPAIGVGLLYHEGYFRQVLDADGRQHELYPFNDPISLPIQPVLASTGNWLRIPLELPGRTLQLRVWKAHVGTVVLYLLDSNDPLNTPADRGITSQLYGGDAEVRLMQEIVLGVGGWQLLEALELEVDVCHINEGHAALVVIERARQFMRRQPGLGFREALWATRAGNVFTTHTPVPAGFDRFEPALMRKYLPCLCGSITGHDMTLEDLVALGRTGHDDEGEPFNMAYLAMRGCGWVCGVSRLHGEVSRGIFQPLYPRWPASDVPVGHVTNGVHMPSWDSRWADAVWTESCGKARWRGTDGPREGALDAVTDERLWELRARQRHDLVTSARERLARHLGERGAEPAEVDVARQSLDPNALTLGFARRFTEYKRPNLLLTDPDRLARILSHARRPVQIVVAGKAHPADLAGKEMLAQWVAFVSRDDVKHRAVVLEDYDMSLAQELVQGVDVWINTPRRPWEACGTSGMKVVVNGGLSLSSLDGWWAEAYSPEVGWAVAAEVAEDPARDWLEAEQLYRLLEQSVVPEFYQRDRSGIPRRWVQRIRTSMGRLGPRYSGDRMVRDYVEQLYLDATAAFRRRAQNDAQVARALHRWHLHLQRHWSHIHFGTVDRNDGNGGTRVTAQVYLDDIDADAVRVELFAEAVPGHEEKRVPMERGARIPGGIGGFFYHADLDASRPARDFTARVVPRHADALLPLELPLVAWQH